MCGLKCSWNVDCTLAVVTLEHFRDGSSLSISSFFSVPLQHYIEKLEGWFLVLLAERGLQGAEIAGTSRALSSLSKSFLLSSKGLQRKDGTIVRPHHTDECLAGGVTSRICSG